MTDDPKPEPVQELVESEADADADANSPLDTLSSFASLLDSFSRREPGFVKVLELPVPKKYVAEAYKRDERVARALRKGHGYAEMYRLMKFADRIATEQGVDRELIDRIYYCSRQDIYCPDCDSRKPVLVFLRQLDPDDEEPDEEGIPDEPEDGLEEAA